ncbi:alpha-amylase family glycosyl hydrolase [Halobiforma nitratireducens]|uniref:Alpha amylase n=1 Tax=Halobiforma nitratireducens JCM 10879 TaxID=1227454 RepID=M0MBC4_9EURY|nr:alpha-amylase family glycosyl hydrolase [Halobiforma nitratireducens]EMA43072.1 alpha amylase [Halobiforma nitratireducens JCM 10879]
MQQPGPPRFCAVGESVELAPREPDPERASIYEWAVVDAPDGSAATAPEEAVWEFEPDQPGLYRLALEAPSGRFEQRVRAFPDVRRSASFDLERDRLPDHDPEEVSLMGPFNEHLFDREHPTLEDGVYSYELECQPGTHRYGYIAGEDFENAVWEELEVPGPGKPRVFLEGPEKAVDGSETTVTADATPGTDSEYDATDLAVEFYVDDRDELTDDDLEIDGHEARVLVTDLEEPVRLHAVAVGERHSVADCVLVSPDGRVERRNDPPAWARDAVVYEIFVRSFTDEETFESLERRVPYLESLGVDCLWLTPVLESPTTHGYHITDYFDTASDLGTREEFESFVDRCHEHDIRVVFDLVINHTAREHAAFDMSGACVPGYEDWYVWEDLEETGVDADDLAPEIGSENPREEYAPPARTTPDGETEIAQYYFNWRGIPNVNYDSLAVRSFFLEVVDEWVDVVDGFRCDVAWGVPHGYWKEIYERVKSRDPEFLLLDETVPREPEYAESEFDVHYDTTLYYALRDVGNGDRPADAVLEAARAPRREGFPEWSLHMRYVENHDETRYLEECGPDAQRAAVTAVLTLPGVPMIYYGQERGATEYRQLMPWEGDGEATTFHRRLVAARHESSALSRGALVDLEYEANADTVVAYARESEHDDETVAVVLNFGPGSERVRVDRGLEPTDLVTGEDRNLERVDGGTALEVEDAAVLAVADDG